MGHPKPKTHYDVHLKGGTVIRVIADSVDIRPTYPTGASLVVNFVNPAKPVWLVYQDISAVVEV